MQTIIAALVLDGNPLFSRSIYSGVSDGDLYSFYAVPKCGYVLGVAAEDRLAILLKLPPDQMKRVEKVCDRLGQTKQSFVQAAVMAEVSEVEEKLRLKKNRGSNLLGGSGNDEKTPKPVTEPSGIGFDAIQRRETEPEPAAAPTATSPVIVNVGGAGAAGGGDAIERMAAFIVAGNQFEREHRTRNAVNILHASAASDEERKMLAERLDAAVAAKLQTKAGGPGIVQRARIAFDQISSLFGSDK